MRATLAEKTAHLLLGGKVTLHAVVDDVVIADVIGSTGMHRVTAGRGGWACSCQAAAHGRRCSHLTAVQLVTDHVCRFDAVAAAGVMDADLGEVESTGHRSTIPAWPTQ